MAGQPTMDKAVIERGAKLSSASLHEAGGKIGALPGRIKPLSPTSRLCAPAFPVRSPPGDNLFLHHAIYAAQPGEVLVVDTGDGDDYGYWGDIMASAAQARGLAGLVITGGVRDSLQMQAMGFTVFSGAVAIRGTGKDPRGAGSVGKPITIGGTTINRGDLVFGDADGVVVLPAAIAAQVIEKAEQRDRDEDQILARLRAGETTLAIYNLPDVDPADLATTGRRSIELPGLEHGVQPIPAASRVGGLIATGGVRGVDPATGEMPADAAEQTRLMFANLRSLVEAGGGSVEGIVKMTIWIADPAYRSLINGPWTEMFPSPHARPARHIMNYALQAGMLVQCEALALVAE